MLAAPSLVRVAVVVLVLMLVFASRADADDCTPAVVRGVRHDADTLQTANWKALSNGKLLVGERLVYMTSGKKEWQLTFVDEPSSSANVLNVIGSTEDKVVIMDGNYGKPSAGDHALSADRSND